MLCSLKQNGGVVQVRNDEENQGEIVSRAHVRAQQDVDERLRRRSTHARWRSWLQKRAVAIGGEEVELGLEEASGVGTRSGEEGAGLALFMGGRTEHGGDRAKRSSTGKGDGGEDRRALRGGGRMAASRGGGIWERRGTGQGLEEGRRRTARAAALGGNQRRRVSRAWEALGAGSIWVRQRLRWEGLSGKGERVDPILDALVAAPEAPTPLYGGAIPSGHGSISAAAALSPAPSSWLLLTVQDVQLAIVLTVPLAFQLIVVVVSLGPPTRRPSRRPSHPSSSFSVLCFSGDLPLPLAAAKHSSTKWYLDIDIWCNKNWAVLSPSLINRSRAYVAAWSARDTKMDDLEEDDADEQDVDYEEEEEEDEGDDDDEDEEEEDFADEEEGDEDVDMGTFSEQGRNFLSKAAVCKHCARNICVERKHGTSSLRKHLKRCKERKKVLRVSSQLSASIMSPDGVSIGHWTFDQALARRELMRMIVLHELAFSLVEYDGFRRFVSSLNPSFKMVCRKTIKKDCLKAFKEEMCSLQAIFRHSKSKISLTSDMWTSNRTIGFICITAHFIGHDWKPQKRIVKFAAMETPHTGVAMFNVMVNFIREWNIEHKLFAMTLDNASNNGAMMKLLKKHLLDKKMLLGGGKLFHQRCAAHVINLICQAGLDFLEPMISKIRDSVKYIRSSQTRKEKFEEIVEQVGISCGKWPSLDTPTRWNSTYIMIDIAREYRAVFSSLAIQDKNYPFNPSSEDWENADAICRLLKVFYEATNVVSGTKYPTANLYFHEIWKVKHTLEHQHYEENSKFGDVVMYMKRKLKRYWKLSWLNLCIPVILDPQFKLRYIKYRFRSEFGDEAEAMIAKVENLFQEMFKEYLELNGSNSNPMTQGGDDEVVVSDDPMADWDNHIIESAQSTNVDSSELDSYLSKVPIRRTDHFDILSWWKTNSAEYPTLSRMAADILAAPASTVASESAFSTGKRVLSDFRSRMTPKTAEALVCLQDWIRATANTERSMASVHDIITELEDDDDSNLQVFPQTRGNNGQ